MSGFSYCAFNFFENSHLSEFSTDLQASSLYSYSKILGISPSSHGPVHVIVNFTIQSNVGNVSWGTLYSKH